MNKMKQKVFAAGLFFMLVFLITGVACAQPADGLYVNGHRYDTTLTTTDSAYIANYLSDMKTINFALDKVIFVSHNQYTSVQAAATNKSIQSSLLPNANLVVGTGVGMLIPSSVIPIYNAGTSGPAIGVSNTPTSETAVLSSIAITKQATKKAYTVGDALDITGMEVTGTYSDNTTTKEVITLSNVTGFDSSKAASQTLTVTVGGKTATYIISVANAVTSAPVIDVTGIEIATAPTKVTYTVGDKLALAGLKVTLTKKNETTLAITTEDVISTDFSANSITTNPAEGATLATTDNKVTITANGHSVDQSITVSAPVASATTTTADVITLTMDKTLTGGSSSSANGFTVSGVTSNPTVTNVAVSGATVTLSLSGNVVYGDTVKVSYDASTATIKLTGSDGDVASFSNQAVTNTIVQ